MTAMRCTMSTSQPAPPESQAGPAPPRLPRGPPTVPGVNSQESAGTLVYLREHEANKVDAPVPVDLTSECIAMMERLNLAQAQVGSSRRAGSSPLMDGTAGAPCLAAGRRLLKQVTKAPHGIAVVQTNAIWRLDRQVHVALLCKHPSPPPPPRSAYTIRQAWTASRPPPSRAWPSRRRRCTETWSHSSAAR